MNEKVEGLKGRLIISCQALSHEPPYLSSIMDRMAPVVKEGGTYGIRANTKEDTAKIRARTDLSVVGIAERNYEDSKVHIMFTMKEINELVGVKPSIIVLNATRSLRSSGRTLDEFCKEIRKSYLEQLLMVDCSTVEEVLHTDQLGFDFVGTALVDYMDQSRDLKIESDDFKVIRQIVAEAKYRVIAEGNINMSEKTKRVIELGAFNVVMGPIITRPQLTTKPFVEALNQYRHINHFIIEGAQRITERRSKIMTSLEKYKDVIPAFYTCYDVEGNVNPERVRALTEYHIREGVKDVYVNESSGECIYQSLEDRKIIPENVMAAAKGRLTVIAHVSCNNIRDSVELVEHAESLGVDAIASTPPIYLYLPEYAIAAYWNAVSQAAPNTNFIIYNIPQLAGMALTQSLSAEMRENPRVIGVKNSSTPVQDIQVFKLADGDDYVIFNGPDEQFTSGCVTGAEAGIGGTYGVIPELFLKMDELMGTGKMKEAMRIQCAADDIIYRVCSGHGNMYGVTKEMLRIDESLNLGGVKKPLPQLIGSGLVTVQEVARMVKEAVVAYC